MIKKIIYKKLIIFLMIAITVFYTEQILPAAAAAASVTETKEQAEERIHREQKSVREGLAPIVTGCKGPLSLVFGYLGWDKLQADVVNWRRNKLHQQNHVTSHDGLGAFNCCSRKENIVFDSYVGNVPSGRVYAIPESRKKFTSIQGIARLIDGRLAAIVNEHHANKMHLMTMCPSTNAIVHGPESDAPLDRLNNMGSFARQFGNRLLMNMWGNCVLFDVDHASRPYLSPAKPGESYMSIKKFDDRRLIVRTHHFEGHRNFIQCHDHETLMPVGPRFEIRTPRRQDDHQFPHTAVLSDTTILIQNQNVLCSQNFHTGKKNEVIMARGISHMLRLKNMNGKSGNRGVIVIDEQGEMHHITIHKDTILSFKKFPLSVISTLLTPPKLRQLSHDQVAQVADSDIAIWSIPSGKKIANFSMRLPTVPLTVKSVRGGFVAINWHGSMALVTPKSDVQMAYEGSRPYQLHFKVPAMKPTILPSVESSSLPATK